MPEFPEFTQGQYGKLTTEVLNNLVQQVQQNTEFITNFGVAVPNQPRGGKGNYPLIAKIGSRILPERDEDDKDEGSAAESRRGDDDGSEGEEEALRTGYRWTEMFMNEASTVGSPFETAGRRGYSAKQNNPAFPTNGFSFEEPNPKDDPDAETTDTADYEGLVVLLFPFANNQGKSILVFQSPNVPATMVVQIVGQADSEGKGEGNAFGDEECTLASGNGAYMASKLVNGQLSGEPFVVYNGAERSGLGMGGKILNSGCEILAPIVAVPNGTKVVVAKAGGSWYFNGTNERCVTCCDNDEEPLTIERNELPNATTGSVVKVEYDEGYGSIYKEMMK